MRESKPGQVLKSEERLALQKMVEIYDSISRPGSELRNTLTALLCRDEFGPTVSEPAPDKQRMLEELRLELSFTKAYPLVSKDEWDKLVKRICVPHDPLRTEARNILYRAVGLGVAACHALLATLTPAPRDDAEWRMRVAEDALSRYIKDTKDTHELPDTDRFSNAVQQALMAAPPMGAEQAREGVVVDGYLEGTRDDIIAVLNKMIAALKPVRTTAFNATLLEREKRSLEALEKADPRVGIKLVDEDDPKKGWCTSTLAIIATITEIAVKKRLAFQFDDKTSTITGVQWYK